MRFQMWHYQAHKYVSSALLVISPLPFHHAHLTSACRPHLLEAGGHLLCIHYTPPPAPTNQEPEQGGRLGNHIVTTADLYVWLSAGGDRDTETSGRGEWALSEWSSQCRASLCLFWQGATSKATWTHTHKHKHEQTGHIFLTWGL